MRNFENAERLTLLFGRWPTFHDAEIVRVVLDRGGAGAPSLVAVIHLSEVTSDVDARGCFVLRNHTLATLRFSEIALKRLEGFNGQNVLFDLEVSEIDPKANEGRRFRVNADTSYGCCFELDCVSMAVDDARPCEARP